MTENMILHLAELLAFPVVATSLFGLAIFLGIGRPTTRS